MPITRELAAVAEAEKARFRAEAHVCEAQQNRDQTAHIARARLRLQEQTTCADARRAHCRRAAREHGAAARPGGRLYWVNLGDAAQHNFILAREDDIGFDIVTRMARRSAAMAVVTRSMRRPHAGDVLRLISKEHIADSVAESIKPFGK